MEKKDKKTTKKKKGIPNNIFSLIEQSIQEQDISILIELYKIRDINAIDRYGDTALHINKLPMEMVEWLVENNADINLKNKNGKSPLSYQTPIPERVSVFLKLGAQIDEKTFVDVCKEAIKNYPGRKESIKLFIENGANITEEIQQLLDKIIKPSKPKEKKWKKQFKEFWDSLVPNRGNAETIQGEVIRIVGKLSHEILDNGGSNWNKDFSKMLKDLMKYFSDGIPLSKKDITTALIAKKQLSGGTFDEYSIEKLEELAVKWVLSNPTLIMIKE